MADPVTLDAVITAVATGEALRTALVTQAINPNTFYSALVRDEDLAKRYARAKELQCQAMENEILDIADAREGDVMFDDKGNRIIDNEAVQRARLRVDARKWILAKRLPKKYGERIEHAGDPENPIQTAVRIVFGR